MNELEIITESKLQDYLKISGVASNLTLDEQKNFLQIAMDFKLNPFKREIYCTSYGQGEYKKTSIIIGYEVYIKRAERTGQLDGWQVVTSGSIKNQDLKATITIHRKDRKFPFIHEVDYIEYVQYTFDKKTNQRRVNKMWEEKPITMLKKVATAQGFRLCFSDELGGMPYDSSELPGNDEREIIVSSHNKQIETTSNLPQTETVIQEPVKQEIPIVDTNVLPRIESKFSSAKDKIAFLKLAQEKLEKENQDATDYQKALDWIIEKRNEIIKQGESK